MPKSYEAITSQETSRFVSAGQDPKTGIQKFRQERMERPVEGVETQLVQDTDTLVGMLDGSITSSKHFLNEERRGHGVVDGVIFLDKSARPVRALAWELWSDLSDEQRPQAGFLNIDKIDYLIEMGFSSDEIRNRYISTDELTLDKYEPSFLKRRTAELRATYVTDEHLSRAEELLKQAEDDASSDALEEIFAMPTKIDGQYIAVVDEVRSSSATLHVADQLLREAFPATTFEPVFWSTPHTMIYDFYDSRTENTVQKLADTEKPLWYDASTSAGRGGIEGKDPALSNRSRYARQRIGRNVLGVPYHAKNNQPDSLGYAYRRDFKSLADKFRKKNIDYVPSIDRSDEDFEARIEEYSGMTIQEWSAARRQANAR